MLSLHKKLIEGVEILYHFGLNIAAHAKCLRQY